MTQPTRRETAAEQCKREHRSFFTALQADAKTYPGGTTALANEIGINNTTLANQLNPNNAASPPSLAVLFELVLLTGGRRTVPAICRLNGTTPQPLELQYRSQKEALKCFMAFTKQIGAAMSKGAEFAEDLEFSSAEREQLLPLLMEGQQAIGELIQALQG